MKAWHWLALGGVGVGAYLYHRKEQEKNCMAYPGVAVKSGNVDCLKYHVATLPGKINDAEAQYERCKRFAKTPSQHQTCEGNARRKVDSTKESLKAVVLRLAQEAA